MALRLMQVFLPAEPTISVDELLEGREILGRWRDVDGSHVVIQLLLPAEETEPVTDRFESHFGSVKGFHVVLFPVEAVLPRPEAPPEVEPRRTGEPERPSMRIGRVSRDELYADVTEGLAIDRGFVATVALSAAVAAVGLIRNDVAVIIGAMVIAPLLSPNIALSLGTTLGDIALSRSALRTNLAGSAVALAVALAIGLVFTVDSSGSEIASRTEVNFGHIALALGAGTAGTFAYTRGLSGAVIGVMVAVALIPPLVTGGMLLGHGEVEEASDAFLLTVANVVGVNLAATATFALQGVRPRHWWEARRAREATIRAIAIWVVLLAALVGIVVATA